MKPLLLVFFGSGLGGVVRYVISLFIKNSNENFPIHTLFANAFACLILGFVMSKVNFSHNETYKYLIAVGLCGGLSTYSTYTLENFNILTSGNFVSMILYSIVTLVVCLGAIYLGLMLGE